MIQFYFSGKEIIKLYRDYGKMYSRLDGWCCYTLTSVSDFESLFGKKADKKAPPISVAMLVGGE